MMLAQVEQQLADAKRHQQELCATATAQAEAHPEKQASLLEDPGKVRNTQLAALAAASH